MDITSDLPNPPLVIEVFTDFVCPWCYLGNAVLEKFRTQVPLHVTRTFFPLHPATPPGGMKLKDLLKGVDLEAVHQRLCALMDELGLEYGDRSNTYNTRLAQELALWADVTSPGHQLDTRLYQAYFVHDQNLGSPYVLLEIAESAGLDMTQAQQVLETRSFSPAVDKAWARAKQYGITGIPAFVAGNLLASGFMPPEEFGRFLFQASRNTG
jgi:predicted DsbA family dithiol-disulfide isomerase